MCRPIGSAGSAHGTTGFTTGATTRRWISLANNMEGISLDVMSAAEATDIDDLFDRLEESGRLVRIDPSARATMYRITMLSPSEIDALRQIEDVVRLGHVRRIEADRIVLEQGEIDAGPDVLHVDCTARGLNNAPPTPVFEGGRIVLQQVRQNSPTFNAALIAFVEANRDEDAERNRLCPPNPYPSSVDDWPGLSRRTWEVEQRWLSEPESRAGWPTAGSTCSTASPTTLQTRQSRLRSSDS